jgi:hypothetical protein
MNLTWLIETLWVRPVVEGLPDVVVTAAWRCNGTDGTYSDSVFATVSFSPPDPSKFIQYQDLKQEEILQWVWASGVDKDSAEAAVIQKINNQINPPIITPPLPWPTGGIDASTLTAPPKPVVANDEPVVDPITTPINPSNIDPFLLPTSDVPPSVDGMSTKILG